MSLSILHSNPYIKASITLFLMLYGSMARPELPPVVKNLFKNQMFRLFILAMVVYNGNRNPEIAIVTALAFVITMNILSENEMKEGFAQVQQYYEQR